MLLADKDKEKHQKLTGLSVNEVPDSKTSLQGQTTELTTSTVDDDLI